MKTHPRVAAAVAYKATKNWETASDPTTLGAPEDNRQYLENRLHAAFMAGIAEGEEIAKNRFLAAIDRLIQNEPPKQPAAE